MTLSCTGPVWACPWIAHSKVKILRDHGHVTMGHHGYSRTGPAQILVCARSNPLIGPVRDLTGHSGHAWSNLVRAPAGVAILVGLTSDPAPGLTSM